MHRHEHSDDEFGWSNEIQNSEFEPGRQRPSAARGIHRGGPWAGRGPGFGHGPGFGRTPKAGRGDIRLAIVTLLAEEPRHGYQIIQEITNRSDGIWKPSPGSIYPTLQALQDEGLVIAKSGEGKTVFALTDTGRDFLGANVRVKPPWEDLAGDPRSTFHQLRREVSQLGIAVMQVGQAGTEDQVKRALKLLSEARKGVYRMLAEDHEPEPGS